MTSAAGFVPPRLPQGDPSQPMGVALWALSPPSRLRTQREGAPDKPEDGVGTVAPRGHARPCWALRSSFSRVLAAFVVAIYYSDCRHKPGWLGLVGLPAVQEWGSLGKGMTSVKRGEHRPHRKWKRP